MLQLSCVALAATLAVSPMRVAPIAPVAGTAVADTSPAHAAAVPGVGADTSCAAAAAAAGPVLAGPRRVVRFGDPDEVASPEPAPAAADTPVARRPRAIEHSDAYYTRLEIHRVGAVAMLPLFGAEYFLGQNLLTSFHPASWVRPTHRVVAYGVAGVFGVNTVTGVWNLWEARGDSNGRTRRMIHAVTMLASDAGFVATGATARGARRTHDNAIRHRNIALASIGLSTASTVYMWLTK
jgi:hypothetical protein